LVCRRQAWGKPQDLPQLRLPPALVSGLPRRWIENSSGNSPNILRAVEWANRRELTTLGCTGFGGGKLLEPTRDFVRERPEVPSPDLVEVGRETVAARREEARVGGRRIRAADELEFDHVVGRHHPGVAGMELVGELLLLAQFGVGWILWFQGMGTVLPRAWIHILYGVVAIITLPAAYLYFSKIQDPKVQTIAMAVACAFLWGIVLRASQVVFIPVS